MHWQVCTPLSVFLASVPTSPHTLTNWTMFVAALDSMDLIGFMIAPTPSTFLIPSDAAVAALQAAHWGAPQCTVCQARPGYVTLAASSQDCRVQLRRITA